MPAFNPYDSPEEVTISYRLTSRGLRENVEVVTSGDETNDGSSSSESSSSNDEVQKKIKTTKFMPSSSSVNNSGGTLEMVVGLDDEVTFRKIQPLKPASGKTQHEYLREWKSKNRAAWGNRILASKAGPTDGDCCNRCGIGKGSWRCSDCLGQRVLCTLCCRDIHCDLLFHRIEKWNGKFFQKAALWQTGVKLYVGHSGHPCPHQDTNHLRNHIYNVHIANRPNIENLQQHLSNLARMLGQQPTFILNELRGLVEDADKQAQQEEQLGSGSHDSGGNPAGVDVEEEQLSVDVDEEDLNEELWQDEVPVQDDQKLPLFDILPQHGAADSAGNPFLRIVHTNGFHHIPVVWCSCSVHQDSRDVQLLDLKLYPCTTTNIRSAFTFQVLDDIRFCNLDLHASYYQYSQRLRRMTSAVFPSYTPNMVAELRRVSRQWRNLKLRKWFGKTDQDRLARGDLALFCAACPQPSVNLPNGWQKEVEEKPHLYTGTLAADGNMTADHVRQKDNENDVWLTEGEGFMTNGDRYQAHLKDAMESVQTPTCHRYRAQEHSTSSRTGLDVTGLGTHCCARHGCFAPGSAVDFQKGERQMNIDWSLCEAIQSTGMGELEQVLHIYDIGCQYHVHLQDRIATNPHLELSDKIKLIKAIGLFHVHAHQDQCLYRYATSYVPGAGVVDGEILETLWALLNRISRSARTASLAHRTELLDDHMGDSNFKKMVNIVSTIIKKYQRAQDGVLVSKKYLQDMEQVATGLGLPLAIWQTEIAEAERQRQGNVNSMDCMLPRIKRPATLKEVQASLVVKDFSNLEQTGDDDGATDWLVDGLQIEAMQIELRQHVRRLGRNPSHEQKLNLEKKRKRLLHRIKTFHNASSKFLTIEVVQDYSQKGVLLHEPDGNISDTELPDAPSAIPSDVENSKLVFPSTIETPPAVIVAQLRHREVKLRQARANDALEGVRETVSLLSFQYSTTVRQAQSKVQATRAWSDVRQINQTLSFHRRVYNQNQRILVLVNPSLASAYPCLKKDDCDPSKAITDLNAPGQSRAQLAWFWTEATNLGSDSTSMAARSGLVGADRIREFYRLHWLRARAQSKRWDEELDHTEREMTLTVLFFKHQAITWRNRKWDAERAKKKGLVAYCEQQIHMWNELGRVGDMRYIDSRHSYQSVWEAI